MNINRDNYENWLLLYIDRELNAADKEAFEAFAAANPDVQQELDLYRQTIITPDEAVCFAGKTQLLQPEPWEENNLTPLQEALLQKLEQTLSATELSELDRKIAEDVLLQKEWDLLRQTKLQVEMPAEMPLKATLYRQEKARVLPLKWLVRVSAAAAVLISGWFLVNSPGGNEPQNATAKVETTSTKIGPAKPNSGLAKNENKTTATPEGEASNSSVVAHTAIAKANSSTGNKPNATAKGANHNPGMQQVIPEKELVTTSSQPEENKLQAEPIAAIAIATTPQQVLRNPVSTPIETAGVQLPVENLQVQPLPAVQVPADNALGKDVATTNWENDANNDIINIAGANINKQKLRGVYRNITRPLARVFEKKPDNGTLAAR